MVQEEVDGYFETEIYLRFLDIELIGCQMFKLGSAQVSVTKLSHEASSSDE